MFVDMSSEMVYPLIPLFLTATLGASPAIVGVIEGIARKHRFVIEGLQRLYRRCYAAQKASCFCGLRSFRDISSFC